LRAGGFTTGVESKDMSQESIRKNVADQGEVNSARSGAQDGALKIALLSSDRGITKHPHLALRKNSP
jgi:hypothetical protein